MHQMGEAAPIAVVMCFEFEKRAPIKLILTACSTPAACVTALLGPSMIQTTAGPSSSEVRLDRLIMERYTYLPWGPRSFHRKIHQSYDAPRMAGDSADIKRNILHDGKHSSKCTRDGMGHIRHHLSCIIVLRQRRCSAAHRFGSR